MKSSISILIVDQEPAAAHQLETSLIEAGFQALAVDSAIEAARLMLEHSFQFLIAGLHMPQVSGLELMIWGQKYAPQTRTILIGDNADQALCDMLVMSGLFCFMTRPLDFSELLQQLGTPPDDLLGKLHEIQLMDLLQILLLDENKSLEIHLQTPFQSGYLLTQGGNVVHAEVQAGQQRLAGKEAFYALQKFSDGNLEVRNAGRPTTQPSIQLSFQALSVSAAQFFDEHPESSGPQQQARYSGDLCCINMLDLIQLCLFSGGFRYLQIENSRTQEQGELFLAHGTFLHASYAGKQGEEAFCELTMVQCGSFREQPWKEPSNYSLTEKMPHKLLIKASLYAENNYSTHLKDPGLLPEIERKMAGHIERTLLRNRREVVRLHKSAFLNLSSGENLKKAIEIEENLFWVSERKPESLLQVNTFLRRFQGSGRELNLLIDPGPAELFATISGKVASIIGDIARINGYSVNHQDPDVGMNATFIARMNPKALCFATLETWRLIRYFDLPGSSFRNVNEFEKQQITFATDSRHSFEIIPTPFCHCMGAFGLYDRQHGVLFSGDLFGGFTPPGSLDLIAGEAHWDGVKAFHQSYMPYRQAVRHVIDQLRRLDPPLRMIVPQHGAILTGAILDIFLERLYDLELGMDRREQPATNSMQDYRELISTLLRMAVQNLGVETAQGLFQPGERKLELNQLMDYDLDGVRQIHVNPERALLLFLERLSNSPDQALVNTLRFAALKESTGRHMDRATSQLFNQPMLSGTGSMTQSAQVTELFCL